MSEFNKISPTANITAHAWNYLGISNSEHFVDKKINFFVNLIRIFGFPYFASKSNDYIYYMLEPRHRAIDYFILTKFPYRQIVELACGFSPRGMTFADNPEFNYIESDLPSMLKIKEEKVSKIYNEKNLDRSNHKFAPLDIFHENMYEKLNSFIIKKEKTIVISEGLTPYFNKEQLKKIFTNIAKFLKDSGGGVYITDIFHVEDLDRNIANSSLMKMALGLLNAKIQNNIINSDDGQLFLKECGFDYVETINPLHFSKQLGLKHNIPAEKGVVTIYLAHVL